MFKGTSVKRRNLLGKDGRSRCEGGGEYIRERWISEKRIETQVSKRK